MPAGKKPKGPPRSFPEFVYDVGGLLDDSGDTALHAPAGMAKAFLRAFPQGSTAERAALAEAHGLLAAAIALDTVDLPAAAHFAVGDGEVRRRVLEDVEEIETEIQCTRMEAIALVKAYYAHMLAMNLDLSLPLRMGVTRSTIDRDEEIE